MGGALKNTLRVDRPSVRETLNGLKGTLANKLSGDRPSVRETLNGLRESVPMKPVNGLLSFGGNDMGNNLPVLGGLRFGNNNFGANGQVNTSGNVEAQFESNDVDFDGVGSTRR